MPYQVLLVDDHKIMRDGIKAILRHSEEFNVIGEAESGTEAVQICKKKRPDIILMDIGLPGLNGIETTTEILRHNPEAKIIILSMYDDEHSVVSAIRSGARAFVLKKASDDDLLDALRTVAKGGSYLSPQVSDRLLQRIQRGDLDSKPTASALSDLSPRELQVLRLVAEGKTSKEIAVMLDLGLQTVRSYRKTMMKKLGVNNVAGLTQVALAAGITRFPVPVIDEQTKCWRRPGAPWPYRTPTFISFLIDSLRPWPTRKKPRWIRSRHCLAGNCLVKIPSIWPLPGFMNWIARASRELH
jgi:DNA-binding NarL/FixJ family response regulator